MLRVCHSGYHSRIGFPSMILAIFLFFVAFWLTPQMMKEFS
jgi:hypothetical protein